MGDGDTLIGKAKVHVSSLSCSQSVKIRKSELLSFFDQVAKAYKTLKGEFTFKSEHGTFILRGEMSRKGHVRVVLKIGDAVTNHPDYTEWQAAAAFNCDPDGLKAVLEARRAI